MRTARTPARPGAVLLAAVLLAVAGLANVAGGAIVVIGSTALGTVFTGLLGSLGGLVPLVGVITLLVGIGQLGAGHWLWRARSRGWSAGLATAGAGAILGAIRFGPGDAAGAGVAIAAHLAVVGLLVLPAARAALGRR